MAVAVPADREATPASTGLISRVTKITMVRASGSARSRARTRKPPAWIQVNRRFSTKRSSGGRERRARKTTRPLAKAPTIISVAIQPETGSLIRPRPSQRITAPARGKAGISQASWAVSWAVTRSPPHQADVVGRGPLAPAEDGHDEGEPDDDLGRRHHQGEEDEDLAADVVEHPGERDEGQVDGVEHELHAHEHDQGVAPHQQAHGAHGE